MDLNSARDQRSVLRIGSFIILAISVLGIASCSSPTSNDDDNEPPGPNITIGESETVLTQAVPVSGGTITVDAPDTPVDGLAITIPENSYDSSVELEVAFAPIESHQLGQHFSPITPLIKISANGGFADSIMSVTIPISIEPDEFAMAFAYDDNTGELEGLAILDLSATSIQAGTKHFAISDIYSPSPSRWNVLLDGAADSYMNIVVSTIKTAELGSQGVISSGFLPGRDDWEFVNRGSHIAPSGHCAGQAMTALWYHETIQSPQLFGLLDTEPELSPDNPLGYKFASTIQRDQDFAGWVNAMGWLYHLDEYSFNAFATAILQTGKPQSVIIRNSRGEGGHAMIIYEVDYNNGIMYVSDPNYPGNKDPNTGATTIRKIEFTNGKFEPYETGLSADSPHISMDQIAYSGKSAFADWARITERWQEVQDGTIGHDRFATTHLKVFVEGSEGPVPVTNNMVVSNDSLWITTTADGIDHQSVSVVHYRGTEKLPFLEHVILEPGRNRIGHEIKASINNQNEWLDFKYITYILATVWIDPVRVTGQVGTEFSFTARGDGTFPEEPVFEWDFDDGTGATLAGDSTITHTYATSGDYDLTLKVFDISDQSNPIGEASAEVEVVSGELVISQVEPNLISPGDTMTIRGYGFGDGSYGSAKIFYTQVFQGPGSYGLDPTDSGIVSWSEGEIRMVAPDYISTGDIWVSTYSPPQTESNHFRVQVQPVITNVWAYNLNGLVENRTWPGGPPIQLQGTGLASFAADPVVTLAGRTIEMEYPGGYSDITVQPIPDDAQSGFIQVTVEGLSSNTESIKIGIEDWLPNFLEMDPYIHVKVNLREVNGGGTNWHNDILHYPHYQPFEGTVEWSGTSFTMNVDPTDTNFWTVRVSGSVNENGTMLQSLDYFKEYAASEGTYTRYEFACSNLPLTWATHDEYVNYGLSASGSEVQTHVSKLEYRQVIEYSNEDWIIDSIEWDEAVVLLQTSFRIGD